MCLRFGVLVLDAVTESLLSIEEMNSSWKSKFSKIQAFINQLKDTKCEGSRAWRKRHPGRMAQNWQK